MNNPILEVKNLAITFKSNSRLIRAVDHISFSIGAGEVLGVVGESGSGKTVTALAILGLVRTSLSGSIEGKAYFKGKDLLSLSEKEFRAVRGRQISMVFQDPMTSLNPIETVGNQIVKTIRQHQVLSLKLAKKKATEMLRLVEMSNSEEIFSSFPFQLSGGMRQRAMIAMALSCQPTLLIADEPTTALDATIQAQVMKMLLQIKQEQGFSILLITHDFGLVAETCEKVIVLFAGKIMEHGPATNLIHSPRHPYTQLLIQASLCETSQAYSCNMVEFGRDLEVTAKCCFEARCPYAFKKCRESAPPMVAIDQSHKAACWLLER